MKCRAGLAAATATLVWIGQAAAVQQESVPSIPVRIELTASDGIRDALQPCLTAALQANPEVGVQSTGVALTLAVIAGEQRMTDGELIGYLIYAGGYQPAAPCPSRSEGADAGAVIIQWQVVRMVPPDLKAACQGIVADFTTSVIVPTKAERERLRQMPKRGKSEWRESRRVLRLTL